MMSEAAAKVVIRPAGPDDFAACAGIVNRWIDDTDWMPRSKSHDEINAMFHPDILKDRTLWLAEADGVPAGYMSLSHEGFVRGFYIDARFRNMGIGKLLMDNAKALFPAGLTLGAYELNHAARAFYAREGFMEVPDGREDATADGPATLKLRWGGGW